MCDYWGTERDGGRGWERWNEVMKVVKVVKRETGVSKLTLSVVDFWESGVTFSLT
jgi:hypothetical protein